MIEDPKELWFYFSVYFIDVYLIYSGVLTFAVQQSDSVIHIYIYIYIIPIPKKGNAKECSHYRTIALISHAKVMLKILQARLQQYVNHELPDVPAGFSKGRGTRDQIANICWIMEKAREFQKKSISALLTMPKPLTVWITINCGKF